MYTAVLIRRHINKLKDNKPFSIRDFLNYGSRNAVDQIFYRLVKSGQIIRVARGIFIKDTSPMPSILEVALTKATAFCKSLVTPGSQATQQLRLSTNMCTQPEAIYACNGSSSSFRFGNIRIRFISVSQRKISLGDELAGLAIRALWYLGKSHCSAQLICDSLLSFNREDRRKLRQQIRIMPGWLANHFLEPVKKQKPKYDFQAFFYRR